jgi:hypothetical protein
VRRIKRFRPGAENQTRGGFGPTVGGISIRVAGVYFVLVGCAIGLDAGHVLITSTSGESSEFFSSLSIARVRDDRPIIRCEARFLFYPLLQNRQNDSMKLAEISMM